MGGALLINLTTSLPTKAGKYEEALKATGKALYKSTGTEDWVNKQKSYLREQQDLYPLYIGVVALESYNNRRAEWRMKGFHERTWFIFSTKFNGNLSPHTYNATFMVSFY